MENIIKDSLVIVFSTILLVCCAISCAHGATIENVTGIAFSAFALVAGGVCLYIDLKK